MDWSEPRKRLLSVDPGPVRSGFTLVEQGTDPPRVCHFGKIPNEELLGGISGHARGSCDVVVETMSGLKKKAGADTFLTLTWGGRFLQMAICSGQRAELVSRQKVKGYLTKGISGDDTKVRKALLTIYGGEEAALGCKASPGPLYGVTYDVWQALGLGVYWLRKGVVDLRRAGSARA